jgi:hypothetical protein
MFKDKNKQLEDFFKKLSLILNVEVEELYTCSLKDLRMYDSIAKIECSALIESEFRAIVSLEQNRTMR